ncbi:MAG TPA: hypothetical protein VM032_13415 [Vicinamibacterales bacterium]|nr:hypothetical protein [Vicinamibacterales bacterium]
MKIRQSVIAPRLVAVAGAALLGGVLVAAQQAPPNGALPLEPFKERGASITPAYEGWFANPDGSFSILLGYFNRNSRQAVDIPVGPNNKIEPGPIDQGQPTHFETGRQWGVLVVKVPKDFGKKALTWTITANGETQSIPFTLANPYNVAPFKEIGMMNEPPKVAFTQGGPQFAGPPMATAATLTGKVKTPVAINMWVEDPKGRGTEGAGRGRGTPSVATVSLHMYRGPGTVTFDKTRIPVPTQGAQVSATATFSEPGEYLLRVQANDESGEGGGGFQCCWTNTYLKATITP